MSAKKATTKARQQADETRKSLIETVKNYWPDFSISHSNLQNPTPTFVYKFYSLFYSEYERNLYEIKENLLKQEPDQIVDNRSYLEEISLAVKLRKLSKLINEAMPFYLNDIFEPQPRRTVLFFSVFMNVLIYMKTDSVYLDEISEVVKEKDKYQNLYNEKQQLLEEIAALNELHFKLESNIQKLNKSIESISTEHNATLKIKAEKEYEYQNLLKLKSKLEEQLLSLEENSKSLCENYSCLQEQFIDKTEIDAIKKNISTLEKEWDDLDVKRNAIVKGLESKEEIAKHFDTCLSLLGHCNFNCNNLNYIQTSIEGAFEINQEMINLKKDISKKYNDVNKLEDENTLLKENILNSENKLCDLKFNKKENIKGMNQKLILLSEDIDQKKNEFKNEENNSEEIRIAIEDLKIQKSRLIAGIMEEYGKLVDKVTKIHNSFNNSLINIINQQYSLE